jgi:hypothetical protein
MPTSLRYFAPLLLGLAACAGPDFDGSLSDEESELLSQCPGNAVCAWSLNNYQGTFSWWPASDIGCHAHEYNPSIRSGFNNTSSWVRFGGVVTLAPYSGFSLAAGANSIVGQICW